MPDEPRARSTPESRAQTRPAAAPQPLLSTLRADPDMAELIQLFVDELPERVRTLQDYWSRGELSELKRVAHQLKGASGGYGFAPVGLAAGELEHRLVDIAARATETDLKDIAARVERLIRTCERVRTT